MVDWDPKEEMGILTYAKFKLRRWVKVDSIPEWVQKKHANNTRNKRLDLGFEKVYTGNSLKYKIIHTTQGRKVPPKTEYYVKIK